MNQEAKPKLYRVWAADDVVYGPVEPQMLREWVRDERILPETWIFCETTRRWSPAQQVPELRVLFGADLKQEETHQLLRPAILRRIRAFGEFSDEDLTTLASLGSIVQTPAFHTLMRANTNSDAIYFVIEGQVRQRIIVRGREILIAVKESGTAVGYISLFDGGPHLTDAVTDSPSTLFRISLENLRKLCTSRPDLGVSILFSLGRTLATRIRSDDRHLCELVVLNQSGS